MQYGKDEDRRFVQNGAEETHCGRMWQRGGVEDREGISKAKVSPTKRGIGSVGSRRGVTIAHLPPTPKRVMSMKIVGDRSGWL